MDAQNSEVIKNCMDTLARRIAETVLEGKHPNPRDAQSLTALSLWRLDDEGIAVIIEGNGEEGED